MVAHTGRYGVRSGSSDRRNTLYELSSVANLQLKLSDTKFVNTMDSVQNTKW